MNLNLKLLARRQVGEGERGRSTCHSNRSTPRTRAGFPERAVLDVVLRVQRGDRRLPSQTYSVVLPMISVSLQRFGKEEASPYIFICVKSSLYSL